MKNILTDRQIAVLKAVGGNRRIADRFYLTGGTPLAAFYLHHRYSEDLDFFSEHDIDIAGLDVFFKTNRSTLGIKKIDFQQSYNRNLFFLSYTDETLKTEFTYFPFPRIEKAPREYGVSVDSVLDIAVNKLFTIYQRTQARDYIDLYLLCRERKFALNDIIKKARQKFDWHIDPLQLGTQFVKAEQASDLPRMLIKLPGQEWKNFFIEQAKNLKQEILE